MRRAFGLRTFNIPVCERCFWSCWMQKQVVSVEFWCVSVLEKSRRTEKELGG